MEKGRKIYASRHGAAFILLFLSRAPSYGSALLNNMEKEVPHFLGDSAMVYRTLHDLEKQGAVSIQWEFNDNGPPKKYYAITEKGWEILLDFETDIRKRQENFNYFLNGLKNEKQKRN